MALADLGFIFWEDSGLTIAFSGQYTLLRKTDLSDNPQDKVLYFGSASSTGSRQLLASSNPGVDQITLTPTGTIAEWAVATAYSLGDRVEPVTPNTYVYEVTTAGTSHATTEPTWPTTPLGSTVTDGTVTWTLRAKKHPTSEIKLALSSGGLTSAIAGAALDIGTQILSGTSNAVPVYLRFTNSVDTVSDDTADPELGIYINAVSETSV